MKLRNLVFPVIFCMWMPNMPALASGEYRDITALREAWYSENAATAAEQGWYPDGVCGIWLDRRVYIGITDDARGEAAKAEILDALQYSDNLVFVTQRYTQRELTAIMRTVGEETAAGSIRGVSLLTLNEQCDCVEIGVADHPSPELQSYMDSCTERWGDAVMFTVGAAVYSSDLHVGGQPHAEIGASGAGPIYEAKKPRDSAKIGIICAAGLLLFAACGILLLRRYSAAAAASGGEIPLYQNDPAALLRQTAEQPPAELKSRIRHAITETRR